MGQKGRFNMGQDEKTKPETGAEKLDKATEQLRGLANEVRTNSARSRTVMLASIETLLAGADVLSWDCINALKEERGVLQGGTQSQQVEVEDAAEQFPVSQSDLEDIEKRLSIWAPVKQAAMLRKLTERMPDKIREYETETAADEARDELLNWLLNNRSKEDAQAFFEQALVAAKEGNGVVALKASA